MACRELLPVAEVLPEFIGTKDVRRPPQVIQVRSEVEVERPYRGIWRCRFREELLFQHAIPCLNAPAVPVVGCEVVHAVLVHVGVRVDVHVVVPRFLLLFSAVRTSCTTSARARCNAPKNSIHIVAKDTGHSGVGVCSL